MGKSFKLNPVHLLNKSHKSRINPMNPIYPINPKYKSQINPINPINPINLKTNPIHPKKSYKSHKSQKNGKMLKRKTTIYLGNVFFNTNYKASSGHTESNFMAWTS